MSDSLPLFGKLMKLMKEPKLYEAIGQMMYQQTIERFEKEEDPKGDDWKPLSEVTILNRRNKNKSSIKILQDTRRLIQSITTKYKITSSGAEITVGTGVKYAKKHQEGEGRIPQRQFLGLNKENLSDIDDLIKEFLKRALK